MVNPRPLIIAVAFALIAVVLVYIYIQNVQKNAATKEVEMATVVQATQYIAPRTTITDAMVEEIQIPADLVPPGAVTEADEILGQVSVTPIYEKQLLLSQMFKEETALADLARQLHEGELAVTIGVTEVSGLGGNLRPGDKVDVLVTILDNEEVGVPSTFTILRKVGVIAVGQNIGFTEESATEGLTGTPVSKSVTLRVNSHQAEILALASEVGSIRLALRHPDDQVVIPTTGTTIKEFTTYTPTREDLEKAAAEAREAAKETAAHPSYQSPPREREIAEPQPPVTPMEQLGPPPIVVEIISGGQVQLVELPAKQ